MNNFLKDLLGRRNAFQVELILTSQRRTALISSRSLFCLKSIHNIDYNVHPVIHR